MDALMFLNQQWVHLIWIALAVTAALAYFELRSAGTLDRFISNRMQARLAQRQTLTRRIIKLLLILGVLVAGVLALMRPQVLGGSEARAGSKVSADIMIVLDVSRSMLAEDATPNRLARAKAEIVEFIDRVTGHRIGLVVFAGRGVVKSPLTSDYGFFRLVLRDVDTRSVSTGGTNIGEAVRKATQAYGPSRGAPRVMVLITDGEDHDSYPLEAVDEAVAAGIRVVSIGFGSESGSEITITNPETGARSALTDRDGVRIISRLDGELLREIALRSEGVYVPAGTSALDLDSIIASHIDPLVSDATAQVVRRNPTEYYRWFVLASLLCLVAAVWVGSSAGGRGRMP